MEEKTAQEADSHRHSLPDDRHYEATHPLANADPDLVARVARILEEREHGIHYNVELAKSRSLRNPGRYMQWVESLAIDQYGSNLDTRIWNPHRFEASDYLDGPKGLREQGAERTARERATRTRIEFQPASSLYQ